LAEILDDWEGVAVGMPFVLNGKATDTSRLNSMLAPSTQLSTQGTKLGWKEAGVETPGLIARSLSALPGSTGRKFLKFQACRIIAEH
jgi:hypothetical protein